MWPGLIAAEEPERIEQAAPIAACSFISAS
jgi:hypothetical protein